MKRGDIRFLGVASYATPVLSTLVLVAGYAEPTLTLALSCGLIVLGALVATLWGKRARHDAVGVAVRELEPERE